MQTVFFVVFSASFFVFFVVFFGSKRKWIAFSGILQTDLVFFVFFGFVVFVFATAIAFAFSRSGMAPATCEPSELRCARAKVATVGGDVR